MFNNDEQNRPETVAESPAKLKLESRKEGTIAAGNAPGLNRAGAVMIVAVRVWTGKHGLTPMARPVRYRVGAVEPGMFGLGPVPAVMQALARVGWTITQVDRRSTKPSQP